MNGKGPILREWRVWTVFALLVIFIALAILIISPGEPTFAYSDEADEIGDLPKDPIPDYDISDLTKVMQAVLGIIELSPEEKERYGITDKPNVRDVIRMIRPVLHLNEEDG